MQKTSRTHNIQYIMGIIAQMGAFGYGFSQIVTGYNSVTNCTQQNRSKNAPAQAGALGYFAYDSSIRSLSKLPPLTCSNRCSRSLTCRLAFSSPRTS